MQVFASNFACAKLLRPDRPVQFRESAHGGVKCMKTSVISRLRPFQSFFTMQSDRLARPTSIGEHGTQPSPVRRARRSIGQRR